ncbi:hypothetical protein GEMRC1_006593 [Eukaryota sp. GEM-RC1]
MKLYNNSGFLDTELASILNIVTISETQLFDIFDILVPLFENPDFRTTLVEWTLRIFKNVQNFRNIPASWFLILLRHVDRTPLLQKHLKFLCQVFPSVNSPESLANENNICFSPTCLTLFCQNLPSDYGLWSGRCLVNSWTHSEEFNLSWTIDSFILCVKSISVDDVNKFEFLSFLMKLNTDKALKSFINSYVATKSLKILSSQKNDINVLENLVDPTKKVEEVLFSLGMDFFNGNEVTQNYDKSFVLFLKAANLHHVESIFKLGCCYYLGLGIELNLEKAAHYFKKSAELGHVYGMINIGYCFYDGIGVDESLEQAFNWFNKSADLNNSEGLYWLSNCLRYGHGIDQILEEGVQLLRYAVELGNAGAMTDLGYVYLQGDAVERDFDKAIKYFQMAVDHGCSVAMCIMGVRYKNGTGVDQNHQIAFELFPKVSRIE